MTDLSIIIVNWNTRQMLSDCLDSIAQHSGCIDVETIVVDNASTDGSQEMLLKTFPQVHLIQNESNAGFARANNQGMASATGKYFLLLNSDALVTPNSLQKLFELAEAQSGAGIIGACLLNPDGTFQASYTRFPGLMQEFLILSGLGRLLFGRWYPSHGPQAERGPLKVDYVEGACLFVSRAAYQQVGGLDESFFMYAEEVDWCYSMKAHGWEVWYQPEAIIIHYGGGSSTQRRTQREADLYRSRIHFFRKHYGPTSALALKLLIYSLTAIKISLHRLLRLLTHNRLGRRVVGLNDLVAALKNA